MNGGSWIKLALGLLFALIAGAYGYTLTVANLDQIRGERLSGLESSVNAMRADLLRIDGKLERLLERRSR